MNWGKLLIGRAPRQLVRAVCAALVLLGASLGAAPAWAGAPVVASSRISAIIVKSLTLVRAVDLDFGQIVATNTAGTVVLNPVSGARTATGGVALTAANGVPAKFAGQGTQNETVAISVSANTITLTRSGGAQTMTMDTFTIGSNPQSTLSTTPKTFTISSSTGVFSFGVAGTLRVGANQTSGVYAGIFTVNITYQ